MSEESFSDSEETQRPRTTREIIDGMPTPTDVAGTLALFAALELVAIEDGKSTPEESTQRLRDVFSSRPEQS